MATSTFDRPLVLTEEGVDNLIALKKKWEKTPPPPVEPYSRAKREEDEALLRQYLFPSEH